MKTSCPDCGSSDAREVYDDHSFCFSCQTYFPGEGEVSHSERPADPFVDFVQQDYIDLPDRRLFEKSLRKYRYGVSAVGGQPVHVANYYSDTGQLIAQKYRTGDKKFWVEGDINSAGLYGEQLWEAGGKRLVITEGELDAVSYAQATGLNWPAVSVPQGAQSASTAIKRRLEFVDSFDEVFFMFDDDEPGRAAAVECASLLTPGKARIITLPLKDASDMLKAGRQDELRNSIFQAKTFRPDGIVEGKEITLEEIRRKHSPGYLTPYSALNSYLRGLHPGRLLMLTAGSGIGKSTLARELMAHLTVEHDVKCGGIFLEESNQSTCQSLIAIDNDVPAGDLMLDPDLLTDAQWEQSKVKLIDPNAFYDAWGSSDIDNIINKVRYFAVGCGCRFVILDHISMVVSGLQTNDERKTLDMLMTRLRQVIEQTGVGVIAIVHLSRNKGKDSFNEGGQISLTDLRGSASIEQLSDFVVALERDQQSEDSANVATVRVLKNRVFSSVGKAGYVKYNLETGRLHNHEEFDNAPVNEEEITF